MGDPERNGGADISAKIAGQEVTIKNIKSVNTIITILTFATVCMIAFLLYEHRFDERGAKAEFVMAIKELTSAQRETTAVAREQNCLLSFPSEQRAVQVEFCKRMSR